MVEEASRPLPRAAKMGISNLKKKKDVLRLTKI